MQIEISIELPNGTVVSGATPSFTEDGDDWDDAREKLEDTVRQLEQWVTDRGLTGEVSIGSYS